MLTKIYEEIMTRLKIAGVSAERVVEKGMMYAENGNMFVKVREPVIEAVKSQTKPFGLDVALISAIVGQDLSEYNRVSTVEVTNSGVLVSGEFTNDDEGWHGIQRTTDIPIWTSNDGLAATLPVEWRGDRNSAGGPLITDLYVLPLNTLVDSGVYTAIYNLCQQWVAEAEKEGNFQR